MTTTWTVTNYEEFRRISNNYENLSVGDRILVEGDFSKDIRDTFSALKRCKTRTKQKLAAGGVGAAMLCLAPPALLAGGAIWAGCALFGYSVYTHDDLYKEFKTRKVSNEVETLNRRAKVEVVLTSSDTVTLQKMA